MSERGFASAGAGPAQSRPGRAAFRMLRAALQNWLFVSGASIIGLLLLTVILAPWLTPFDPTVIDPGNKLRPPDRLHLFGTDEYGRDVLARVLYGARISMRVGLAATVAIGVLGAVLGCLAGYFRTADAIISRIGDSLLNFPGLIIGIMVMAALGPSEGNVVLAMVIMYTPRVVRLVRASVIETKAIEFVDAARTVGAGDLRILMIHIFPHAISPLVVQLTFGFAWAILVESSLSFLGLGTPPPAPSWGNIISDGREFIRTAPWIMIFAGLMISVTVTGLNLMGDGLRDLLDPRQRNSGRVTVKSLE